MTLHICKFNIRGFNKPWIINVIWKKCYVVADLYVVRPTVVASVLTCTDIIFLSLFLKQCLVVGILCNIEMI